MSTIIKRDDIRKGDKLKVTYLENGLDCQVIGVAHRQGLDEDWTTEGSGWLTNYYRKGETITLLERPKTAEEILAERRDALVVKYAGAGGEYVWASELSKKLVDRVIELEDEKEALNK